MFGNRCDWEFHDLIPSICLLSKNDFDIVIVAMEGGRLTFHADDHERVLQHHEEQKISRPLEDDTSETRKRDRCGTQIGCETLFF